MGLERGALIEPGGKDDGAQRWQVGGPAEEVDIGHDSEARVFVDGGCGGQAFERDEGDVLFLAGSEDWGDDVEKARVADDVVEVSPLPFRNEAGRKI